MCVCWEMRWHLNTRIILWEASNKMMKMRWDDIQAWTEQQNPKLNFIHSQHAQCIVNMNNFWLSYSLYVQHFIVNILKLFWKCSVVFFTNSNPFSPNIQNLSPFSISRLLSYGFMLIICQFGWIIFFESFPRTEEFLPGIWQ